MEYKMTKKTKKWEINIKFTLKDNQQKEIKQAITDYKYSRDYINKHYVWLWKESIKKYELYMWDRLASLEDKKQGWRSNISSWISRASIDILSSTIKDVPLFFKATWINKKWFENKDNITKVLNYIWNYRKFHKVMRTWLFEALKVGNVTFKIWYEQFSSNEKIYTIVDWDTEAEKVEETRNEDNIDMPFAEHANIFNLFPDIKDWDMEYITERKILSYDNFIKQYEAILKSTNNESPMYKKNYIKYLLDNKNWASFVENNDVLDKIREKQNTKALTKTLISKLDDKGNTSTESAYNKDDKWYIELLVTWYKRRLVIMTNNYPVYIWVNPYGFIPYVYHSATDSKRRFWVWIPTLLWQVENSMDSVLNTYIDSVRASISKRYVAVKTSLTNASDLEDPTPWKIIYTEETWWKNVIYPLETWIVTDHWLQNILMTLANTLTWVSDYNKWISVKERTATWASAVADSANNRLNPYIESFFDGLVAVWEQWLHLTKEFWSNKQYILILDEEGTQTEEYIRNTDLIWKTNITLDINGLISKSNRETHKQLVEAYNLFAGSWFIDSTKIAKEILKNAWINNSDTIMWEWEWIIPEDKRSNIMEGSELATQNIDNSYTPSLESANWEYIDTEQESISAEAQALKEENDPWINLGNQWRWA